MSEDLNQKDNQQKSSDLSEDQPKKERKNICLLDKLIVLIVISIIGYTGVTFLNCNFLVPGSIESANALGGLKNPPPLKCEDSQKRGFDVLFMLLSTLIALKVKVDN